MSEGRRRLVEEAQRTISAGSKSFRFASQIFDLETRERSWLLYAWCRACDDVTDGQTLGHDAKVPSDPDARIAFLTTMTDAALAGRTTGIAPFDALGTVAAETATHPRCRMITSPASPATPPGGARPTPGNCSVTATRSPARSV